MKRIPRLARLLALVDCYRAPEQASELPKLLRAQLAEAHVNFAQEEPPSARAQTWFTGGTDVVLPVFDSGNRDYLRIRTALEKKP